MRAASRWSLISHKHAISPDLLSSRTKETGSLWDVALDNQQLSCWHLMPGLLSGHLGTYTLIFLLLRQATGAVEAGEKSWERSGKASASGLMSPTTGVACLRTSAAWSSFACLMELISEKQQRNYYSETYSNRKCQYKMWGFYITYTYSSSFYYWSYCDVPSWDSYQCHCAIVPRRTVQWHRYLSHVNLNMSKLI